jgi:hypothetical protein
VLALCILTSVCLVSVLVLERAKGSQLLGSVPSFHPPDDGELDRVYADALKRARAVSPMVSTGFELANLDLNLPSTTQAARRGTQKDDTVHPHSDSMAQAPGEPQPKAPRPNRLVASDKLVAAAKDLEQAAALQIEAAKGTGTVIGGADDQTDSLPESISSEATGQMSDEAKKEDIVTAESHSAVQAGYLHENKPLSGAEARADMRSFFDRIADHDTPQKHETQQAIRDDLQKHVVPEGRTQGLLSEPYLIDPNEGGSQLASVHFAPKPIESPKTERCQPCEFLPTCQVNPEARGWSRSTGMFGMYPSAVHTHTGEAFGGGVTDEITHPKHASTLRQLDSSRHEQRQAAVWTELSRLLGETAGRGGARRLLEEAFEGGEMLASFSMPHKPKIIRSKPVIIKPKPKPAALPPLKCVCPHCKLGDEQIGLEDEQHTIAPLSKTKKIEMIDDELMKLDPTYAMKRIGMSDDGTK